MFVNNYAKIVKGIWERSTPNADMFNGSTWTADWNNDCYKLWANTELSQSYGGRLFLLGNGTYTFSRNDTTIPNMFDSVYGIYTHTTAYDNDGNAYCQFSITFTNNSSSEITATRIYWTLSALSNSSNPYNMNNRVLIWEEELTEPITIAPGASFNYNLKLTYDMN